MLQQLLCWWALRVILHEAALDETEELFGPVSELGERNNTRLRERIRNRSISAMQRESEADIFANAPRLLTALPPLHQTLASATKTEVYAHRRAASNLSLHIRHENRKTLHAGVKLLSQLHLLPSTVRFTCDSSKSNRYFMKQGWSIK